MLKNYLFGILFVFVCSSSFGQGEANNWFFGGNAGVSFTTGTAVAIENGKVNTTEGSASISDASGNLLFYTDGIRVWNKNHQVMPNGTGLNGDPSSTSSGLIVPSPGNSNIYYVFTVDEPHHDETAATNHGLNFSVVDMSLSGGDGEVIATQKNIPLITYNPSNSQENKYKCSEKITAVRSGDCSSFWVITHFTNKFYSFKVSSTGVNGTPVVSNSPVSVPVSGYRRNAIGYIKSSPDGSKLAVAHSNFATSTGGSAPGGVFLYDFDITTGVVSNELEVYPRNKGNNPYGVEFSRSGDRLYTTVNDPSFNSSLVQFDLTSPNIISTEAVINTSTQYAHGALQLGPDGKIYRALYNFNQGSGPFLGVINDPEEIGTAANYVEQGVALNIPTTGVNELSRIGLPPFIQSLFAEKVDIINNDNDPTLVTNTLSLCENETFTLAAEDIVGATYTWTLDGNSITNTTFNLVDITAGGTYLVEINPNNGDCPFLGEAIVTVLPLPIINASISLESCFDPVDGISDFTLSDANAAALVGQLPTVSVISYHSNNVEALSGNNPIATAYSSVGEIIYIRLLNSDTGCVNSVPVALNVNPLPVVTSPVSLEQCDTDSNGSVSFNLNEANVLLSTNSVNELFVYYNSLADAQSGNSSLAIPNSTSFQSTTGVSVYASVTNDKGCVSYGEVDLLVGTSSIPVATEYLYSECDDDYDGITTFDFSSAEVQITSIFPASVSILISYYENEADALAETNAIPDISNHQNTNSPNIQRIWVRVDSQDLNGCLGLGEHIVLTVNPLPIHNSINDVLSCSDTSSADFDLSNATVQALNGAMDVTITYHETQPQAELGSNILANPYSSVSTTLFIRAENNNTGCYTTSMSVNLIVNSNPVIVNPDPMNMCEDLIQDGFTEFNLTQSANEIINGATGLMVSYYTIESEALAGSGPSLITDPAHFTNTINPQEVYVSIENVVTGCISNTPLMLEVVTAPQGPLAPLPALTYCDTDNDGFGFFDLTTLETAVTSGISGVSVEFFETTGEADLGVGAINTSTLYQNVDTDGSGTGYTQVIYAQLTLDGFTSPLDCYTLVPITLLVIDSPELPSTDLVYKQCEEEPNITDGFVSFDLTSFEQSHLYTVILNNASGDTSVLNQYSATYYTQVDASGNPVPGSIIPNPNAYENTSTPDQLIYVSVEHVGDATAVPSIPGTGCSTIKAITLHVDLLPSTVYTPYVLCDDDSADGKLDFDLTLEPYYSHLIDGATDVSVDFYTTLAAADFGSTSAAEYIDTPTSYENEFNPQSVFARVYNSSTGCYAIEIMHLEVSPNPTPLSTIDIQDQLGNNGVMEECDGNVDGSGTISEQIATFDLTLWETQILNNESGVSAAYYTNIDDAEAGTSSITNPATYNNIANPQTIYVSVINDGSGIANASSTGCYTIVSFELYVPVPEVTITASKDVICVDANGVPLTNTDLPVLTANALPAAPYDYQWMLNGVTIPGATNQSLTVTESGDYTVSASGPTDFDCINVSAVVTIEVSGVPDGFNGNVTTTAFADSHQIVAEATSTIPGIEFWYSLDGAEATTDGTFDNVLPGTHIVTISDGENCWTEDVNVTIIDYPHFFTPNGDGVNDTWAIIGQEGIPISQIYIFDRFGKLLKQLDPDSEGWDGMYNGTQMPASDYWFKIMYIEGDDSTQKEFKAHFSLKR